MDGSERCSSVSDRSSGNVKGNTSIASDERRAPCKVARGRKASGKCCAVRVERMRAGTLDVNLDVA